MMTLLALRPSSSAALLLRASTSVVAKRDPQLPQGFTPVAQELTIWPGDRVTMTCVYDASKSDRVVTAGSTHNDEM